MSELDLGLKWPNDVLVGERKLAGLLAEVVDDAVVVGLGLNVSLRADELPVPTATSLAIEGSTVTDREPVLRAVLRDLAAPLPRPGRRRRRRRAQPVCTTPTGAACTTVGQQVRVTLPGDRVLEGTAVDVDPAGRLVVDAADGRHALAAGDVVHVR